MFSNPNQVKTFQENSEKMYDLDHFLSKKLDLARTLVLLTSRLK
jgi:hypothetical protein